MSDLIQNTYENRPASYVKGWTYDNDGGVNTSATSIVAANNTIKPGEGVYYDAAGKWVKPTNAATSLLVTHIAMFTTIAPTAGKNYNKAVQFVADDKMDAMPIGTIVCEAGAALAKGARCKFNTDGTKLIAVVANDAVSAVIATLEKATADGDLVPVRIAVRL